MSKQVAGKPEGATLLEEEEEEEEEEQEADTAVEPAPPATHPAAGAHTGLTDEELAGLDVTSVELLPDAEREAALAAPAAKSAGLLPRRFKRNFANSTGLTKSLLVTT